MRNFFFFFFAKPGWATAHLSIRLGAGGAGCAGARLGAQADAGASGADWARAGSAGGRRTLARAQARGAGARRGAWARGSLKRGTGRAGAGRHGGAAGLTTWACCWASGLCTRCTQPVFGPV